MKISHTALVASLVVLSVTALANESLAKGKGGFSSRSSFSGGSKNSSSSFSSRGRMSSSSAQKGSSGNMLQRGTSLKLGNTNSGNFNRTLTNKQGLGGTTFKPRVTGNVKLVTAKLAERTHSPGGVNTPRIPGVVKPKPVITAKIPGIVKKQPVITAKIPGIVKKQPVITAKIPGIVKKKPVITAKIPGIVPGFSKGDKPHDKPKHKPHHHKPHCFPKFDWCHHRPTHCYWWYDYCEPIRYCAPVDCVTYTYDYVTCGSSRWYLGMTCTLLPGKGYGIDTVEAGSPAALAGLAPGMVITRANQVDMLDEAAMPSVIANSGGVLNMTILPAAGADLADVSVAMTRLLSQRY